jgi:hypothetical protein
MCLDTVTKRLRKPRLMRFYKTFVMYDPPFNALTGKIAPNGKDTFYSPLFDVKRPYIPGLKYRDRHSPASRLPANSGVKNTGVYPFGFHGFATIRGARKWRIKNELHGIILLCEGVVHTIGKQDGCKAVVARTLKIAHAPRISLVSPCQYTI